MNKVTTIFNRIKPLSQGLWLLILLSHSLVGDTLEEGEGDMATWLMSPFIVKAQGDRGYGSTTSMGASRIALPNSDVASSIITLNEQILSDMAAVDAAEVLNFVSGVRVGSDHNPGQLYYTLRGYALNGINLRDGLPDPFASVDMPLDEESAYERIEVIKGPAGTLYGSHSMGGIVNKVSKWPSLVRETNFKLQAATGSDEFIRAVVDTTGSVGTHTAYRAIFSLRNGERHYDESDAPSNVQNLTLSAMHYFEGLNNGKIWARVQSFDYELDREQGWQFLTGYLGGENTSNVVNDPAFAVDKHANTVPEDDVSEGDVRALELGYEGMFAFGESDWTFRVVSRYSKGEGDKSPSYSQGRPVPVDSEGIRVTYVNGNGVESGGDNRYVSANDSRVADWRSSLTLRDFRGYSEGMGCYVDMIGRFSTFGAGHDLVLNANLSKSEYERAFFYWSVLNENDSSSLGNTFSAINPDFTGINSESIKAANEKKFNPYSGHSESESYSVGFQDNISFFDKTLIFVVGARYDSSDGESYDFDKTESIAADEFIKDADSFETASGNNSTHKLGIVYKPIDGVSLFAHESSVFHYVSTVDTETGKKFPNQDGEIKEVGLKLAMFDNRLIATISIFDMELSNVIINVENSIENGGGLIPKAVGVQATEGYELDLAWQPTDQFSVLLSLSNLESIDESGNYFRGVPIDLNYSLLGKYRMTEGSLAGLYAGAAYQHNSKFAGDKTNTFILPGSELMDVFFGYDTGDWSIQLNAYNIMGEDGPISAVSDRLVIRAPDTNYRLSLSYRF